MTQSDPARVWPAGATVESGATEPRSRTGQQHASHSRALVIAAFATVYVIWGSTYLGIRYAIETLPPFMMASGRFIVAGLLLFAFSCWKERSWPSLRQWRAAFVIGALLLLGGNGAVVWAEQTVPSGLAALLVSITPLWMVLFDWMRPGGARPPALVFGGIAFGLVGIWLLAGPGAVVGGTPVDPRGVLVLLGGSISWAIGSLYSRRHTSSASPWVMTATQMLAGGLWLGVASLLAGEPGSFDPEAVSVKSMLALVYLTIFGALIAYTAYIWLLTVSTAAKVSTYAYVNPVVAVILGWAFAGEALTPRTMVAAAIIIVAVAIITVARRPRQPAI